MGTSPYSRLFDGICGIHYGLEVMKINKSNGLWIAGLLAIAVVPSMTRAATNSLNGYVQTNLTSNIASNAPNPDVQLVNPWGLVAGPDAVWVNNNGTGLTKAYRPSGAPYPYGILVSGPGGGAGTPSGLILNETFRFAVTNSTNAAWHAPAVFLMATEDGTIAAWNPFITGTNAVTVVDNSASNAVYKGLAMARGTNGASYLYAANFHAGVVDVFDAHFQYVSSFTDTNAPAGFAPFNIRNIGGKLFVTYAVQDADAHDDVSGPGNGLVDVFDASGNLVRSFASGGALNSPWGMAVAPPNFGQFGHALLIGNFGDGRINAFDLASGQWLGQLTTPSGDDLVIDGLWGLAFDQEREFDDEGESHSSRLYFTAGINHEADGLFGYIRAVSPQPKHRWSENLRDR